MTKWNPQANDIFLKALELRSPSDRRHFLSEACSNNPPLRNDVQALLDANDQAGSFLEKPAAECLTAEAPLLAERLGTVIGPYKLMEQIGEGGMGLVYVAEQRQPIRRKVALKLIKPGMDTRQVIARFEAERQALALMNHPNIAKVFDGGETPNGRPYFVMELVRGVPITEYCDEHRLTPRACLELFGQVCAAVQHAHQKGIIHRDIKPSNVIISSHDGTPVVKVIDFGVAKAIGQQLTDKTVYTQVAQFIGTPLYMSPEQAGQSDLDIDTRTDVYALGVLLYELLTGTTPFDKERLSKASYDEIRRLILEEEPPKPSTRMSTLNHQMGSTLTAQRQSNPHQLSLIFRGELDWIVMKALEKDRNRRYESASALAADVERYLKDEPVQACPPSRRYLVGKFLRRHRSGVRIGAASLTVIFLFAAVGDWIALDRAARQTEADRQRRNIEIAVEEDLKEAVFQMHQQEWVNVRQALERANGRLAGSGLNSLEVKVEQALRELGVIAQLEDATMMINDRTDHGSNTRSACDGAFTAAFAKLDMNPMALSAEEAARRIRASPIRNQLVVALDRWVRVKMNGEPLRIVAQLADNDAWRQRLREPILRTNGKALELLAKDEGVLDQLPSSLEFLSRLLLDQNLREVALSLLRRTQQRYPTDYSINMSLGYLIASEFSPIEFSDASDDAKAAEAISYFRAAIAVQPQNPRAFVALANTLAGQFSGQKSAAEEAEAACRKAIALKSDFFEAHSVLSQLLHLQHRWPEAETELHRAIALNPKSHECHQHLARLLRDQGRYLDAATEVRKCIAILPDQSYDYALLGEMSLAQRESQQAEESFLKAIVCANDIPTDYARDTPRTRERRKHIISGSYNNLGMALHMQMKLDKAEAAFLKSIEIEPLSAHPYAGLGWLYARQCKFADSSTCFQRAHDLYAKNSDHAKRMEREARHFAQLARLESKLPLLLKHEIQPSDIREVLSYAALCQSDRRQLYSAAVRLYREAFEADSKFANDMLEEHRYGAACAAALAGCGRGNDADNLDPHERARLREHSLVWLQADLTAWRAELAKKSRKGRDEVVEKMIHWQHDGDFDGVRGEAVLANLPEAERQGWQKLWIDVENLKRLATAAK